MLSIYFLTFADIAVNLKGKKTHHHLLQFQSFEGNGS